MNTKVITIARQYGSGGHEIGKRLAKRLNYEFYNKEIINHIAQNTGLSIDYIQAHDEVKKVSPALKTDGRYLSTFYHMAPSDQIFIETKKVIKNLAAKAPCVIVGRCADYLLEEMNCLHIYCHAPMLKRVERKLALLGEKKISEAALTKTILHIDKQRKKYYEYYAEQIWGMSTNYNLCLDTSITGIDGAVQMIIEYLKVAGKSSLIPTGQEEE